MTTSSIEMVQKRALRVIYPDRTYSEVLKQTGLCTLKERRDTICVNYFKKMINPRHKLHHILPKRRNSIHNTRNPKMFSIPKARTNRYKNSLIPWCANKF